MAATQESDVHAVHVGDNIDEASVRDTSMPTQPEVPLGNTSEKKKRRLLSDVWKEFHLLPLEDTNNILFCACNKCGQEYPADSKKGTGNLRRHIKSCQLKTTREMGEYMVTSDKTHCLRYGNPLFTQEQFREFLVEALILHDLPLSFVEYKGIRKIFEYLEPRVDTISRNTAKSDILKLHDKQKIRLRRELVASPSRICLTSDAWTSIATDGYMSLTAHYVDSAWVLQKKILNFSSFPPPHTGIALSNKIVNLIKGWGIEKKLFSITLDNASSNDNCVGHLIENLSTDNGLPLGGLLFHVRCCAHILNLIVQDGLKEIDKAVGKIRECVKYIRGSPGRKIKFSECVAQASLQNKKGLHQDVPTRWNSTYIMLSGAIYYRRAFRYLRLSDSNFQSCPSDEEWEKVSKICEFLEVFYNATNTFSGSHYTTSNLFFPRVFLIQLKLVEKCRSEDIYMKKIAEQMFVKFNKYWSEFNLLLAIALVFDPRYKYEFLEFSYGKLYGPHSEELNKVKSTLDRLYNAYATPPVTNFSSCSRSVSESVVVEGDSVLEEFDNYQKPEAEGYQKSQLELYLEDTRLDRSIPLDMLEFWKSQQFRYPDLSKLARDVLCVPVSTVASESAFSLGGRILDQYRSSLKAPIVEALVCTRDWLFGGRDVSEAESDEILPNVMATNVSNDEVTSSVLFEATNSNVV